MRVSAKAEYACIAMLDLASNYTGAQPVRVKSIADAHGIPQRFLVQILLQLKSSRLVASVRGASGGYQLARSPEEISLADIINAVDREQVTRPATVDGPDSAAIRAIRAAWLDIQAEEQRLLEQLTLGQLLQRMREEVSSSYQI